MIKIRRFFYSLLIDLLFPFVLLFIMLRALYCYFKFPGYLKRFYERFGLYSKTKPHAIWIHAVSGGEVIAIKPIIEKCLLDFPEKSIVVTTMTLVGAMQVERLFGKKVKHAFVPYDYSRCVSGFLNAMQPEIALFVETEIWPELLYQCKKRCIPALLMNARLSEKSYKRYKMFRWFFKESFRSFAHIAVQTEIEASRFAELGVPAHNMSVTGNLKFDVERPASLFEEADQLRKQLGCNRFVWCAASTHKTEEEIVLKAHQFILKKIPDALLVLVPKHLDRFSDVAILAAQYGRLARRSQRELPTNDTPIYLGDTIGELVLLYCASDVAFVGGSLIPHGGHNLLEPASVGRPVLSGRYLHNFHAISQWLQHAGALTLIDDAFSLAEAILHLQSSPVECQTQGKRAKEVCIKHRGALQKQYQIFLSFFSGFSYSNE